MSRTVIMPVVMGLGLIFPSWLRALPVPQRNCGLTEPRGNPRSPESYRLYAWQDSRDEAWKFCFEAAFISVIGDVKGVVEGRGIIRGVAQLEQTISKMAPGSDIQWNSGLGLRLGDGSIMSIYLEPPPQWLFDRIKRFAAKRHVQVWADYCRCDEPASPHDGQK